MAVDESDDLISRILADGRRIQRAAAPMRSSPLLDINLTMQQLKVLISVAAGITSGQSLAEGLGVTLATITGIVDRLAGQHLVGRREDPHDRRIRRVELTDKGQDLLDQINTAGEIATRRVLRHLTEPDLRIVARATRLLSEATELTADEDRRS
ncbi:MAG: MarR family transcriptional regulator [Actinocatenispora sp.]